MGRMIDVNAIRYEPMLSARGNGQYEDVMVAYKDQIDDLPTIEERKTGKWIFCENETGEGNNTYKCSACGEIQMIIDGTPKENGWKYCPHCGAKMDGEV